MNTSRSTNISERNIWVVLPTYNEAGNLPRMLDSLSSLPIKLKVVIVDDASPDGTGEIASSAAERNDNIHVVRRTNERGLGTAYLTGFRHALAAGADAVLTMDCDFSHDPVTIPALVKEIDGASVVIGSRYVPGGLTKNWGFHRKVLSASANRFARSLFRMPVLDCTSGFRLYRREVLENVLTQPIRSTGYAFLVEILYLATRGDEAVKEVPICFVDRELGRGKMGLREIVDGIANLLRLRMDMSAQSAAKEDE